MRIIFCGTPEYAVPSLRRLNELAPEHSLVGVVSQPDKPKGRSGVPTPPPVAAAARELGIAAENILQPLSINTPEVLERLRALQPDVLCVIAYGGLLRKRALELARLYPLNAHASLLPKYRGAAPIQAALLAGDAETGVCIMKMERGLDTGPLQLCRKIPIAPTDDAGTLHDKLAALSGECFVEALKALAAGPVTFTPQDEASASYAAKLEKDTGRIDWSKDAAFLERFVRAMNPWPGAWTSVSLPDGTQKQRIRVAQARLSASAPLTAPGEGQVLGSGEQSAFAITTGSGVLEVLQLQPEGKKPMSVGEYIRGAGRKFTARTLWQ